MSPQEEVRIISFFSYRIAFTALGRWWPVFVLTVLVAADLRSQVDSVLTLFPLGAGYRWQYTYKTEAACGSWDRGTSDDWIDKDTLLANGKRYWIRNRGRYPQIWERFFLRLDSTTANVYQIYNWPTEPEYLIDSLRMSVGDTLQTWFGGFLCVRVISDTICGVITRTKQLIDLTTYSGTNRSFSYGFGLSFREFWSMDYPGACAWGSDLYKLVYARIGMNEYGSLLAVEGETAIMPQGFMVSQNYPNPFNPSTTFQVSISRRMWLVVTVYDLLGREVTTLMNEEKEPGIYTVVFDGVDRPSGVYLCRVTGGNVSETKKLVLMR